MRSRIHFCLEKVISISHFECVFVALVIQHAQRMRPLILPSVACLSLPYFSTLSHKRYDFRKNVIELNYVYWFSLQILSTIFFYFTSKWERYIYVLLTVHLGIILDNDQPDAHLLYFTIYLLHFSTCFEHYMLIIRKLNCIDTASGILLSVSGRPVQRKVTDWEDDTRCCINTVQPPDDEHTMLETYRGM